MKLQIDTMKNKKRIKAIKIVCDNECLDITFKKDIAYIVSNENSFLLDIDCILESIKATYAIL